MWELWDVGTNSHLDCKQLEIHNTLRRPMSFLPWDSVVKTPSAKKATVRNETETKANRPARPGQAVLRSAWRRHPASCAGISAKGVVVGYFDNADDFAHAVRKKPTTRATTSTPTSIRSMPVSSRHSSTERARHVRMPTSPHLLFILVDGDPERDHPKGGKICTTDTEHAAALAKIKAIKQYLIEQGCPANAIIENDSGNGSI